MKKANKQEFATKVLLAKKLCYMIYIVRLPSFIIVVLIIKMILFFTDARYERPGIDVMNSFGKGIHKYVGLEVNNIITLV